MKKLFKELLVFLIVVFVIFFLLFISAKVPTTAKTDRFSYKNGDPVEVSFKNRGSGSFCFSSCFPFYLEMKDESNSWKKISYSDCRKKDTAEKCMSAKSEKTFEFFLSDILPEGEYRLAFPLCVSCKEGDSFKEEKWIYSNKFKLKP